MLAFKKLFAAQSTLAEIELVAMIKKGNMRKNMCSALSHIEQFYILATLVELFATESLFPIFQPILLQYHR